VEEEGVEGEEEEEQEEPEEEEEEEADRGEKEEATTLPLPPGFQMALLKRFARKNGVPYEKSSEIMNAQMLSIEQLLKSSIRPMRPSFALVNYMKDLIRDGEMETPLKVVDGMCACHACQAMGPGSNNSLGCAFHDLSSDF
jgi:hypothetical protein